MAMYSYDTKGNFMINQEKTWHVINDIKQYW